MLNLDQAIIYDLETFPNCWTFSAVGLHSDWSATWEISQYRDDRQYLMEFLNWLRAGQTPMIGFNNVHFDYPIVHHLFTNPGASVAELYDKAMSIIRTNDRFANTIWADQRFAPQIDLLKINHFDNPAKSTSLKALQINMRSPSVVDMPVPIGTNLTPEQIERDLMPYNLHDCDETRRFALHNMEAIRFRVNLIPQFGIDVVNWSDTKIGAEMMIARLGKELCYDRSGGRRKPRQTPRTRIALADIIFSYITFNNPEFKRVLDYLRGQVLQADEIDQFGDDPPRVQTKGVFTDLTAHVGGLDFHFGTGGIHASMEKKRIVAAAGWRIRDIDVASLYPSIAIVNRLAPAHLGEQFSAVYAELPRERKRVQAEKGKKCVEANALKLASNGVYGNSNNIFSPFYDPQFTLAVTVNGQLMLCMLAEWLLTVPTLQLIQVNTDGITYYVRKDHESQAAEICRAWEKATALTLEDADYARLWLRDVNNYIAEGTDGSLKLKGAYWTPDPLNYHASISSAQPPAWHKDLSNLVSTRAAVAQMVHGVPIEQYVRMHSNPFDFMCRAKAGRADRLLWGGQEIQRTTRYYVATDGQELTIVRPPPGSYRVGMYKKANGVDEAEYWRVMNENGGQWDERVCTKNRSVYAERRTAVVAGHVVGICNDAADFDWSRVNYDWYIREAEKLVI